MAASTIRIDTDASRNITGLAGGADGRIAILENVGAFNAVLKDESASSTASNRFDIGSDITIPPQGGVTLRYDATLSRWYCIGSWLGSSSASLVAGTTPITSGTNYTILIQDGSGNLGEVGPLADGEVLVGQTGTSPTARQPSGDWTWDSTAVATIANDAITTVKILDSNVTLAKIANIADQTILGNNTGGAAAPVALTAAQSRVVSRVDQMTTHGNSDYTILNTDRVVATSAALTTDRTWTLPAANTLNAGQFIIVADLYGGVTSANTLIIARDGTDTINGGTSLTIAAANNVAILISDGSSKWSGTLHSTAFGTVTQVTSSDSSLTVTNGTTTPDAVINVTHVNTWQVSQRFNYQCFDLYDTSNDYRIKIYTGETLTADRVLTLIISDANRNITLSGDLTVSASATISGTNTGDVAAASQAEEEAATSTTVYTSPGRQQYHPGVAKCWASIDQTGTQAILASHNITSNSDGGVGISDVTIATDFSSANWACVMGAQVMVGVSASVANFLNKAAGTVSIRSYSTASALFDTDIIDFAGFGDHA